MLVTPKSQRVNREANHPTGVRVLFWQRWIPINSFTPREGYQRGTTPQNTSALSSGKVMWKDKSRLLLLQVRQGLPCWTLSCNSRWCAEAKNPHVRQVPLFQWYAAKNRYWNATHPLPPPFNPSLHPWTESHSTHEYYILLHTDEFAFCLIPSACLRRESAIACLWGLKKVEMQTCSTFRHHVFLRTKF